MPLSYYREEGAKEEGAGGPKPLNLLFCHAFTVFLYTENQNHVRFYPFVLHNIFVLFEFTLGHLHYHLKDMPPSQTYNLTVSLTHIDRPMWS